MRAVLFSLAVVIASAGAAAALPTATISVDTAKGRDVVQGRGSRAITPRRKKA